MADHNNPIAQSGCIGRIPAIRGDPQRDTFSHHGSKLLKFVTVNHEVGIQEPVLKFIKMIEKGVYEHQVPNVQKCQAIPGNL